jgi:DNA-binding NtrC family response regulator
VKPRATILVGEDDEAMRELLEVELRDARYQVVTSAGGAEALTQIERHAVDAVVTDLQMPGMTGDQLLKELRVKRPGVPVVIITAFGTIDTAVRTMKAGAYHFVPKPFRMEQLLLTLDAALTERREAQDLERMTREATDDDTAVVARCPAMQRTLDLVSRAATADTPVLLLGESGTGKELLARALHSRNAGRKGRFIAVNCSAIPENLMESQLFGHRRGSFTDAREDRPGLFQEANGGTIFLDEVGDMPVLLQAKLLRVLQEKEVHPLGAAAPVTVDVRVIAATHHDLAAAVREGRFRQDLYYRLNVIAIQIPPLRERSEDILPLIAHFLHKHGLRRGRSDVVLAPAALEIMRNHSWPGNVRELENVIERALVLGGDRVIGVEDLPDSLLGVSQNAEGVDVNLMPVALVEREHILKTLRAVAGNKAAAARLLGLDRKTLYRKLKIYQIKH